MNKMMSILYRAEDYNVDGNNNYHEHLIDVQYQ